MRILVHDFSGHPFQVQLSRALAGRGHEVLHVHCDSYRTGKGALEPTTDDPSGFGVESIDLGGTWDRYSWAKRVRQEVAYGAAFCEVAARFDADVVLASNDPLFAKVRFARWAARTRSPWVFWLQDVYSVAMGAFAREKLGPIGSPASGTFEAIERRLLRRAAGVVAITDDFLPLLASWGIASDRVTVIENWAPMEEVVPRLRPNSWSDRHDLSDRRVVLYSGTLGLKHDPALLLTVAERHREDPSTVVVVISEGLGADWLRREAAERGLDNLRLLPFAPWSEMSDILASADVLTVLLEPDAGVYSVPSKVLTYLCAGQAIVGAMPTDNLGARTIVSSGAGRVVAPGDRDAFVGAIDALLADDDARRSAGRAARAYAEATFDIETITDRFEGALEDARGRVDELVA